MMLTKFWDTIGKKLADRWFSVSVPALFFYLGGLVAWLIGSGTVSKLQQAWEGLNQQFTVLQAFIVVVFLLCVVATGELVAGLTAPMQRFLEGYWPSPLNPIRRFMIRRVDKKVRQLEEQFQKLAGPIFEGNASPDDRSKYVKLDQELRRYPTKNYYQPTHLGNILRAAEIWPAVKYGLNAVTVWPHLWLIIPSATQEELASARQALNSSVAICLWGLLFLIFIPFSGWALPVGMGVFFFSYKLWVLPRAEVYGILIETVFDLYRFELYSQLRWSLPPNPHKERIAGKEITTYLWRGLDGKKPKFCRR